MFFKYFLAALASCVVLLSQLAVAQGNVPTIFIGSFPPENNQLIQYQTYNITWGGANLTSVDVYLKQQEKKDVMADLDRSRDTPLSANVTVSPYKWNVTQPVGTFWTLTFAASNASLGTALGTHNLEVLAAKSAAVGKVATSLTLIFVAVVVAALGAQF